MKKIVKIIAISFMLILNIQGAFADGGSITGIIQDKKTNEPIIGATVLIEGTTIGAISDYNGNFVIKELKPGKYNVVASFISYVKIIFKEVKVEKNKTTELKIEMFEAVTGIKEVVVSANRSANTEVSMLNSIKTSQVLVNGISSQQITKSQDRDASEVVKRVPGITIQQDRFIVVRGLSQRYNNVWLNNLAVPSSEADVKAFSFDVIPSSMIDNILIYKTASPEIPAEFAGGFIKIFTKDMPENNSVSVSYSLSYNAGTTFEDFSRYKGGKYDWLGFDDGTRALPSGTPSHLDKYNLSNDPATRAKLTDVGRGLNNNWTPSKMQAPLDQRFSVSFSRRMKIRDIQVGNISALNYSYTFNHNEIINNNYSIYDYAEDKSSINDEFKDEQSTSTAKVGLLSNWTFVINSKNKIEFKNIFNQIGWSRSTLREGREWYNDGRYIRSTELRFLSRTTYAGQLAGTHALNEKSAIKWNSGYAYANKKEPDLKRYKELQSMEDTTVYLLSVGDISNPDLSAQSRMFLDMTEHLFSNSINYSRKIKIFEREVEFNTGLYSEIKSRNFQSRNLGYSKASPESTFSSSSLPLETIFASENINLTTGLKLMEVTGKSDSYYANNFNSAGYVSFQLPVNSSINISAGLRVENNIQQLNSYKQGQNIKIKVNRNKINLFPSINSTYNFNDKNLLRFAYGMTINRPEFREVAPFYFVDFDLNAGIYGNPDIKECIIHNFDFRYESYFASGEMLTIGAFYKNFSNPIEMVILGNNPTQFSFENVKEATSYGVEVEIKKSLSKIAALKNFTLVFNTTILRSQVKFDNGKLERDRSMQGQAPYIINSGLYYQNSEKGIMMSLLYNIVGKRIIAVGRPSPNQWEDIPNIFELHRNNLDFTFSKKVGKHFEIKGGVKDIINEKVEYFQSISSNVDPSIYGATSTGEKHYQATQIDKSYKPGRYYTLGLSYKF